MSTPLANPAEMIRMGAPRIIRSDEELAEYTEALFELTAKTNPTAIDEEAIELIGLLIDRYESERYPIPRAEPAEVLRFLLEHNSLSQRDIAPELGSESTVSLVLSGKRQLNRDHIARLSRRFHVSPAVFFGETMTLHEAMRIVLLGRSSRMGTARQISDAIAERKLYTRADGGSAKASQINARAKQYPELFEFVRAGIIRLRKDSLGFQNPNVSHWRKTKS
jgi:HTH-type transcriptional regulator / antitoxin HigA